MASCNARIAKREQWAFRAGMPLAASITSLSVSLSASSRVFPIANSVAMLEVEMAPGQPWVKNLKADILPSSTLRETLMKISAGRIPDHCHGVRVLNFSRVSGMHKMVDHRFVINEITTFSSNSSFEEELDLFSSN